MSEQPKSKSGDTETPRPVPDKTPLLDNPRSPATGTDPAVAAKTMTMKQSPQLIAGGQTFADFMYAVVIGVAFSDIKLFDSRSVLVATIVLLLMVLEDFFMYQTQVKPLVGVFQFWTLRSLFFEMSMLLSWFLSFLSRKESLRGAVVCIGIFFFLKWLASALRIPTTKSSERWVLHRDHLYLMTVLCAGVLAYFYTNFLGTYIVIVTVWFIQTCLWWLVVKAHER